MIDKTAEKLPAAPNVAASLIAGLRRMWFVPVATAVLGALVAFGYSSSVTPEYEATATVYVTSATDDNAQSAYQGSLASQQRVTSYSRLVTSDAIITEALRTSKLQMSLGEARNSLRVSFAPNTVLLNISAVDPNARDAERLANAAATSMSTFVARLEAPSGGGSPLAKVTLITPASASSTPVSPKTSRNIALGAVIGLFAGVFGVLTRARFSNRIRVESDILLVSDSPVLASIPTDDFLAKRGLIDFKQGAVAAAEAFRKLRTNLAFANVDKPPRIVIVTSAVAVEGKTTTAMNLAAALVEAGSRVVLVDADLRRPQIDSRTGLVGDVGFTNFLRGDGELNDLVQPTQLEGLWILASGPKPPNPAELVGAQRAGQALAELAASFDFVIVDCPPVLPVTDAVVLSQWADGVLIVARAGSTRVGDLSDALTQVLTTQTPVIGHVLTEAAVDKKRYGYYAVQPKQKRSIFNRGREPKAIEQVLEPKKSPRH